MPSAPVQRGRESRRDHRGLKVTRDSAAAGPFLFDAKPLRGCRGGTPLTGDALRGGLVAPADHAGHEQRGQGESADRHENTAGQAEGFAGMLRPLPGDEGTAARVGARRGDATAVAQRRS